MIFALALIMLQSSLPVFAQDDCKMCGTWTGAYTLPVPAPNPGGGFVYENFKMIVRVKQYGNNFTVRVKTFPIKETDNIEYWNDCDVTKISEENLSFSSFVSDSFDWTISDRKNGCVISRASYWKICKLTYHNGRLVLTQYLNAKYYDRNGLLIGTHDNPSSSVSLYQDDDDW